ncbi:hypothetical protein GN316_03885 [Xylophilus sp. Kf1]|nr:hypothetical protein [Xylophilus sp. Kf1]
MPQPDWSDTQPPSRATRRRMRLRQDFEDSLLASDLGEEDPTTARTPPAARRKPGASSDGAAAAVPSDSEFRRDHLMRTHPLPAAPIPLPVITRADASLEYAAVPGEHPKPLPAAWRRISRTVTLTVVILAFGLLLTKGLAEMVWELVGH